MFGNDLLYIIESDLWGLADDLKMAKRINSIYDANRLQSDINRVMDWCERNGMPWNEKKSKLITITRQRQPLDHPYTGNGEQILRVATIRDLGVVVDQHLRFDVHIDEIVRKATRMTGFIMRICKNFNEPKPIISLFNQIVRPKVEYCSPVWNPYYAQYSEKIESLQHMFTRYLYRKFNYPYESYDIRLTRLGLTSLIDRRRNADVITLHKIVHGTIHCSLTNEIQYHFPTHGLRNVDLFKLPRSRTNIGKNAPLYRLCSTYNESYNDVDIFSTERDFKKMIRSNL